MEKLNEYLQELLSKCGYELHLEPNKNPYVVTSKGNTDVASSPLPGAQINTMIFALLPAEVKQQLPNQSQVEFVHPHNLGDFNFVVKKSPSGFNVTVSPSLADGPKPPVEAEPEQSAAPPKESATTPEMDSAAPESGLSNIPSEAITHPEEFPTTSNNASNYEVEILSTEDSFTEPEKPVDYSTSPANVPSFPAVQEVEENSSPVLDSNDGKLTRNESVSSFENTPTSSPLVENTNPTDPAASAFETSFPEVTEVTEPVAEVVAESIPQSQPAQPVAPTAASTSPNVSASSGSTTDMDSLFRKMAEVGASDLHLSVSVPPMVRKDGRMAKLDESQPALTAESMKSLLMSIMPEKNVAEFDERNDTDFAYEIPGLARFRSNIFRDRKGMGGVFRIIPSDIMTAEDLNLSKAIMDLCELSKGLVVVTGPTGSGKSTTLCAMVDSINKEREDHIITIEDPIEFTHENQKCLVNQREVHNHTDSFKDALRAALREDPDILLVGEMRDLETISIAIETAETGHLVFGTLHTTTAASTVDRIIDQFPADRQQQVRVMLSESLRGVIAQTLLPKIGGGRIAALEVLIVTPAISNLIREGKTFQIPSAMQTGKTKGMVMLNDALMELVNKGLVEPKDAYIKAVDKEGFEMLLKRSGKKI